MSVDGAERLTRATFRVLAVRITGGEAQDLASQLPDDLNQELTGAEEAAHALSFEQFEQRVRSETQSTDGSVAECVRVVFSVLSQAVTPGQFDDVVSHLPREFRDALDIVE